MHLKSFRWVMLGLVPTLALVLGANLHAEPAVSAGLLRDSYLVLAHCNHDYKGHRVNAMKQIQAAAKVIRFQIHGDEKFREPQGASDQQMVTAKRMLEQAEPGLPWRARRHVGKAIRQIDIALSIR